MKKLIVALMFVTTCAQANFMVTGKNHRFTANMGQNTAVYSVDGKAPVACYNGHYLQGDDGTVLAAFFCNNHTNLAMTVGPKKGQLSLFDAVTAKILIQTPIKSAVTQ